MYSTCLFCNDHLGRNESLEHFPVGRRLAFDAARGRLWVICPHCARWNLSPLESRWEAIEEAERAYRGTRLRSSTDNIGLAKLREGTTLVRIGQPLLPEFAGWRYGSALRKRRLKFLTDGWGLLAFQTGVTAPVVLGAGYHPALMALGMGGFALQAVYSFAALRRLYKAKLGVRTDDGTLLRLSISDAATAGIVRHDDTWSLDIRHRRIERAGALRRAVGIAQVAEAEHRPTRVAGKFARRALSDLIPCANLLGGSRKEVAAATELLMERPGIAGELLTLPDAHGGQLISNKPKELQHLPRPMLLALEMALHDADERRALDGEFAELEIRWREAEEIASIADRLTVPTTIDEQRRTLPR